MRRRTRRDDEPIRVAMVGLRGIPASYGGVETAVEQLAPRLVESGVEVTVYTRPGYVDAAPGEFRGVRLRAAPVVNTKHFEAISHTFFAVLDALRPSRRIDVIHFHATGPALLAWIPRLAGVDTVVTIQGWDWRRGKWGRPAQAVLRLAARMAVSVPSGVIGVSEQIVDDARRLYGRSIRYIPNGVTGPQETPPTSAPTELSGLERDLGDRPVALFLGRIVPEKEVLTLARAFRNVEDPEARLVIAGPSSHSDDYVAQVTAAAEGDPRITVLGPQYGDAKFWLFSRANAFVQPSNLEGLPLTLLEAIAFGAYPVVSRIAPHMEAVNDVGQIRDAAPAPGDVDGLATALADALALDPDEKRRRSERLQASVADRYDWDAITTRTVSLYRDLVTASSTSTS